MAHDNNLSETQFTPRRNPKRTCSRQEPWEFDDDECTYRDGSADDEDFKARCSTPAYGNLASSSTSTPKGRSSTPRSGNMSSRAWNKLTEEYDPDNDVFIHDVIRVKFDTETLRSQIKHLMNGNGIPPYKRALNKCIKQQYRAAKLRKANRLKYAQRRKMRKEESDTELDDTPSTPIYSTKCTPESTLRAMIYTRDFLKRMASKRKRAEEEAAAAAAARKLRAHLPRVPEAEILKGMVAFVDVISHDDEDVSTVIGKELKKLGAEVVPTFTKNDPVSIVLFNDGHVSTYQKAKKRGVPLVSVLWIEECRNLGAVAPTSQFPPSKMERYESPEWLKKLKKRKFLYGLDRMIPRKQRNRSRKNDKAVIESPPESETVNPCEVTPKREPSAPEWLSRIEGANGMMKILVNMTGITEDEFLEMMGEPCDSEKYEASPLPVRLLHKLARELSSSKAAARNESSSNDTQDSDQNVQSNANGHLASAVTEGSFMTPEEKKLETLDGDAVVTAQNLDDSDQNELSGPKSILATALIEKPLMTPEDMKEKTHDEGTDVASKNENEGNFNPTPLGRRVSTRIRSARRMLTY